MAALEKPVFHRTISVSNNEFGQLIDALDSEVDLDPLGREVASNCPFGKTFEI